jgi:hypothetical protein
MLLFFIFVDLNDYAQESLQADINMFRINDKIIKQQVTYKNPGRGGENVLWNFGDLKAENNKYSLIYSAESDSTNRIAGTEHQTRYYYELRNDSLLLYGYENPTTKVTYLLPEVLLHFPMKYGDNIESYYQGEGIYCDKLQINAYGSSRSLVDAYGMMILPNGDTLRHVTRVRTIKLISEKILPMTLDSLSAKNKKLHFSTDSIQRDLNTDSVVLMTDTYRWYAAGYRYPVFETVRTGNYRNNSKTYFTTAFFYPPEEHQYLADDENNEKLREEIYIQDLSAEGNNNIQKGKGAKTNAIEESEFTYNIFPNPVETQLTFEFFISKDAMVSYELYNILGAMIYGKRPCKLSSGAYADQIEMNRCIKGEYILRMQVNKKVYSEKIIKR